MKNSTSLGKQLQFVNLNTYYYIVCVCVCVCMYKTVEYYSAIKRMKFCHSQQCGKIIMLSEISLRKKNTVCYHLYVESEK